MKHRNVRSVSMCVGGDKRKNKNTKKKVWVHLPPPVWPPPAVRLVTCTENIHSNVSTLIHRNVLCSVCTRRGVGQARIDGMKNKITPTTSYFYNTQRLRRQPRLLRRRKQNKTKSPPSRCKKKSETKPATSNTPKPLGWTLAALSLSRCLPPFLPPSPFSAIIVKPSTRQARKTANKPTYYI